MQEKGMKGEVRRTIIYQRYAYSTAPQKRKSDGGVDAGLLAYMVGTHSGRRAGGGSPSMGVVTFVRLVRGSHVLTHITA